MNGITEVVAMDLNGVIGKNGDIPWKGHLLRDMKHFRDTTTGKVVVYGRKTYDSLDEKFKPLPKRENFVLTRNGDFSAPGCTVLTDPDVILRMSEEREVFVIGGAEIYKIFLPVADRLLITKVETEIEGGDTFFPELPKEWNENYLTSMFRHVVDERNKFSFHVYELTRHRPVKGQNGSQISAVS